MMKHRELAPSLARSSKSIDVAAVHAYAVITDDFNPIHIDPEFAARTPIGQCIAHGTMSLNLLWQAARATLGAEALETTELDIRFVKPVFIGDMITASGSLRPGAANGAGIYDIWAKNQKDETVIVGTLSVPVAAAKAADGGATAHSEVRTLTSA